MLLVNCAVVSLHAQSNTGELRLRIEDPAGLGVKAHVEIRSNASQYYSEWTSDDTGKLAVKRLPFGAYQIRVEMAGFSEMSEMVEVHSALPVELAVHLGLAAVASTVTVKSSETLIDPVRPGSVNLLGENTIQLRTMSLPGRSLQDLVNSEPGWLYEGNAVLHPRGSEYQTQFVLDGIPLTDNRSPSFGPEIEADEVEAVTIYTAGFPAEFGRKMGGVVEVNTFRDAQSGLHGETILSGGSFDTAGAFTQLQYGRGRNSLGVSATGNATSHYLNPVVPENYTNAGTTGDFGARYERDFTPNDQLTLSVRHEFSRYEIPNEQVQQAAGQLQNGSNSETIGMAAYQHIFSTSVVGDLRGMVRENADELQSNARSTPLIAFMNNNFREIYAKGDVSVHHGRQEWKFGIESDNTFLHENFRDAITDPTRFAPGTPATFSFSDQRPAIEQSGFLQDMMRMNNWTISAGLRWDHYQLVVNENAVSPRLSAGRYFPTAGLLIHTSYDRIFQTPSFENILLASSTAVASLNPDVLRLPVEPSHGNYFEAGLTKALFSQLRFDVNVFRRQVNNMADDDQLLSTAVSFPIAFRKGIVYGAEGKLDLPNGRGFSGYLSYSYSLGNAWFPVTGGLFLGEEATQAQTQLRGHFPVSQDQRNTVRTRFRYALTPKMWVAVGADGGSGLPFVYEGTYQDALNTYGPQVVDRLNFSRGRVRPSLSVNASVGTNVHASDRFTIRLQADGENLNNRLNLLDFAGLFSGNAIGPGRSAFLRVTGIF